MPGFQIRELRPVIVEIIFPVWRLRWQHLSHVFTTLHFVKQALPLDLSHGRILEDVQCFQVPGKAWRCHVTISRIVYQSSRFVPEYPIIWDRFDDIYNVTKSISFCAILSALQRRIYQGLILLLVHYQQRRPSLFDVQLIRCIQKYI